MFLNKNDSGKRYLQLHHHLNPSSCLPLLSSCTVCINGEWQTLNNGSSQILSFGAYMAHSVALATLGLTKPNQIQHPKISFAAREVDLLEWKGDILAVGVTENDMVRDQNSKFQNLILQKLDSKLGGLLSETSSEEDFSGKSGQSIVLRLPGLGSKRIGLVGLGSAVSSTIAYRTLGGIKAQCCLSNTNWNCAGEF